MISSEARRLLDRAGFEVVKAVYVKELGSAQLPRDAANPVYLSGGQVRLDEVVEWLQEIERAKAKKARALARWTITAAIAAIVAAVAAILAWLFPLA